MKKVIVVGGSGLIGSHLIQSLLHEDRIEEVVALVRKPLDLIHAKLKQHIVSFDNPGSFTELIYGDAVFCCLGSTVKKTPDLAVYRKIDYDYPLLLAEIASEHLVPQFHLISSIGADSQSVTFYTKTKGELEDHIKALKFKSQHIYQPSLLDGDRKEARPTEKIMISVMRFINPILLGPLKKYRSIKVKTIANAMVIQTLKNLEGTFTYPSDKIKELI
ncbi:nucleoside-diphosphate-sugar epimerase [Arcticibacter svalbardensis MN12-7]|uniref:Nucleoside-diphosphate-sugar epimerase n=1 Tax=Arcticibacter svalbardensis MN12-7 TaxID=1150600 RepID=R9GMV8_9SPHI|nr:NAD(P)H-binding protein [Arcticibacter svalbardensis]EOR93063.1 nucleoside-diphosphate-sugar epimerase [Arcticibacter svalbardensis MN12-7]